MRTKMLVTAMLLFIAFIGGSIAAPITTLFNTGVDANGTPLNNNDPELHYTLASVPAGGVTAVRVATSANGAPIPPWSGDNSISAWIGPNSTATLYGPVGTYDFRTTFDLTGFDPVSAAIAGNWVTDNAGTDVLLNGQSTGQTASNATLNDYTTTTPFSLSSGFNAGLNTIDFIVSNFDTGGGAPNPVGLRVEFTTASANSAVDPAVTGVPEPGSMTLLGTALLCLGLGRRPRA